LVACGAGVLGSRLVPVRAAAGREVTIMTKGDADDAQRGARRLPAS